MEDLFDKMLKLKSENKFLKKLCETLMEKMISLENYHSKCNRISIMKY